jgi:hypothetical protein
VCHFVTPEEKAVTSAFRPLLRYDLLVRKNKCEFLRPTPKRVPAFTPLR